MSHNNDGDRSVNRDYCLRRYLTSLAVVAGLAASGSVDSARAETPRSDPRLAAVIAAETRSRAAAADPSTRSLVEADIQFSADARARGVGPAFSAVFDTDGKLIGPDSPVVIGPDAVGEAFKDDQAEWWWAPVEARVNGDLGVTWGIAAILLAGSKQQPYAINTRYVTAWRRGADGHWRIWLDIGNRGPAPAAAGNGHSGRD